MARKPNYGHEKRQREIKRQKKKAEKAEKKRLKAEQDEAAAANPSELDSEDRTDDP